MKKLAIPVIVDEMNVMHQLHRINVAGMSWPSYFRALGNYTNSKITPYFACANVVVEKDSAFYEGRLRFFNSLRDRGVRVLEGFTVHDAQKQRIEKGVDVLVALQIYKEALQGARDIILCSADSDLVPAVLEVQKMGVRVHVVISDYAPGLELADIADRVISLEQIMNIVIENGTIRFKDETKPFLFATSHCFKKVRKGVCSA